ncbi:hypothetical protein N5079_19865 [Planotetraspora sp. A-T 1434]|uniref:hypothetical protein n=1 Tax=Planotetraspora sp. A-T 1434 TaxID=2979219 RepID=UPI0021C12CC8|nr:hypothetical protein [Planotetraspora sp. A-T 1434]MCT9932462.1 hypothetical protein [Planotetraspora sp. A-T 1434]
MTLVPALLEGRAGAPAVEEDDAVEMSADDRIAELIVMTAHRQRRERWFALETTPPASTGGEAGDAGDRADPSRAE